MFIQCCYCQKDMGEKEPLEDHSTSHGICDDCFKEELEKLDKEVPDDIL